MPRNGTGTYSLPATYNPVVTNTPITIAWANNTLSDIATAVTNSIACNGETTITANLPMSGYIHTGVGNAALRNQYPAVGQVQDSTFTWGGTAGGTADALTIALSPPITAYAAGQAFDFIVGASPNATTTPTLAVNGLAAKTIVRYDGSTCAAGDLPAGARLRVLYDGTNMRLNGPTFVAPTFSGNVTVGTINKVTITQPASSATLTIANGKTLTASNSITLAGTDGKTLTVSNNLTLAGTDSTTMTFPATSDTVAGLGTVQTFTKAQRGAYTSLTDGATITPDFTASNQFNLTIGGNRTLGAPSTAVAGQTGVIYIRQDATGSRTLAYAWPYVWPNGATGTLSTAGCSLDQLVYDIQTWNSSTVTITIASPGVVTWTGHGLVTGQRVQLTTTGALPTGLSASTTYFWTTVDANTGKLSTSLANAAAGTYINTSGTQSGTHTMTAATIALSLNKAYA
jgi:hypothetical protein